MLLIRCPYCEAPRPEVEFRYGGEALLERPKDPSQASYAEWTDYLWVRKNPKGRHAERWRHVHGCGRFFNAARHTVTDIIEATWRVDEQPPADFEGDGA
jgi:sarcosine oxidase subunit delta